MIAKLLAATTAVAIIIRIASCAPAGPSEQAAISDLARQPARYEGKNVTVTGRVAERVSVFGAGGFRLADADGSMLVVLGLATPPQIGEMTTVTGSFRTAYAVGEYHGAILLVH